MAILPIDSGRYGSEEMRLFFTEQARYQMFLEIEATLAHIQAEYNLIPHNAAAIIKEKATISNISMERIHEHERETGHELVAVLRAFAEICQDAGKFIHYGTTSSDILDTAMALQLKKAIEILEVKLHLLLQKMLDLAEGHISTPMIGRTHGQHALPITFGFKVALWADTLVRNIVRLQELKKRVLVGKISGAVGSMAGFGPDGLEIERRTLYELGLESPTISSQAVARDRLAEFIWWVAIVSAAFETIATEVRNLQRPEIREVTEPFMVGKQVGSSTMPHKRNPVLSENVCSLARLLRSLLIPALENVALWHERDLTNSANERFIVPQACILLDEILEKMLVIIGKLDVDTANMQKNLDLSQKAILSESLLLALVAKGMDRKEAYTLVQRLAFEAQLDHADFIERLRSDITILSYLNTPDLAALFEEQDYLGSCKQLAESTVLQLRKFLQ